MSNRDAAAGAGGFTDRDRQYMGLALEEAHRASEAGDVPVGAVLVRTTPSGDEILATGRNTREAEQNALGHAELRAIGNACKSLSSWRLADCTLYVTLEPCPMCAGAIIGARVGRVVCGTRDPVAGAMGSVWALHCHPVQTRAVEVRYGCREEECRDVLQKFFRERRRKGEP